MKYFQAENSTIDIFINLRNNEGYEKFYNLIGIDILEDTNKDGDSTFYVHYKDTTFIILLSLDVEQPLSNKREYMKVVFSHQLKDGAVVSKALNHEIEKDSIPWQELLEILDSVSYSSNEDIDFM